MLGNKSPYQKRLQDNLAVVLRGYAADEALEIDKRLAELQQELINHASRKEDYNDIADEIFRLREMKQKNFTDTAVRDEQVKRINELNDFISNVRSSPDLFASLECINANRIDLFFFLSIGRC